MFAKLIDHISYRDGHIENREAVEVDTTAYDFDVVEDGLQGWGSANAVVLIDGSHYLAKVTSK